MFYPAGGDLLPGLPFIDRRNIVLRQLVRFLRYLLLLMDDRNESFELFRELEKNLSICLEELRD